MVGDLDPFFEPRLGLIIMMLLVYRLKPNQPPTPHSPRHQYPDPGKRTAHRPHRQGRIGFGIALEELVPPPSPPKRNFATSSPNAVCSFAALAAG